ncbi:beta propeller repeat protein [Hymenobacter elongatus]|uniref:Photosynthesis system II assembly factor Ycf48/Hcf136-like domain-containing protein n=1 Tax=Hymenobacter elongatus TaxID=877208 RepID=A0A4Z0PHG5_9BACT|nr:hypothetical protein [Hymenobacter elongatus]TGE12629.1 hypothetical protein E5J99_20035 [Hymenobacter elongatus]
MKKYVFPQVEQIQQFQFLTDSSGILLDGNGHLYSFQGSLLRPMAVPTGFTISHFHFTASGLGAVIGNAPSGTPKVQEGSLGGLGLVFLLLVALVSKFSWRWPAYRLTASSFSVTLLAVLGSCASQWQKYSASDPDSRFITLINRNQVKKSAFHHYQGNKGQKSFIGITQNEGQNWQVNEVPTNFYLTAVTAIGNTFTVGTHANNKQGAVPMHGDGDIWLYGNDTRYTALLADNTPQHPYGISIRHGINGFALYPQDSLLFVFGTETMPTFPKDEISTAPGNIYCLPTSLKPVYKIIDAPDSAAVHSLTKSSAGELWITLENRVMRIINGTTEYRMLATKKLCRLQQGSWRVVNPVGQQSFVQVEFVPGTNRGYVLTDNGQLLISNDNGDSWTKTSLGAVRTIHAWPQHAAFLQGPNQLLVD